MQEPHDRETRPSSPRVDPAPANLGDALVALLQGWRILLPVALAVVAAAAVLMSNTTSTRPGSPPPTPDIAGARSVSAAPAGNSIAAGQSAGVTPTPRAEPQATPTPSGPTAVPTLPPARRSNAAPVR
ncbi:MAG: hypothetical protein Q7T04_04320, partial [Dehalococcoidia bacterium]|nr:hypothetical protein [Dehalococcoidia bacterium]